MLILVLRISRKIIKIDSIYLRNELLLHWSMIVFTFCLDFNRDYCVERIRLIRSFLFLFCKGLRNYCFFSIIFTIVDSFKTLNFQLNRFRKRC